MKHQPFSQRKDHNVLIRITERNTKLQPNVKVGSVYELIGTETTPTGILVAVVYSTETKSKQMNINAQRFTWELVTLAQLQQEQAQRKKAEQEAKFRESCKTDVQRILEAFTVQEHVQITFIPLVLNEIAWEFARRAMALGARDKVQDLKKLSRVLKQLRKHYEKVVCQDLLPSDLQNIQRQSLEFMQEHAYHFQIMYYTLYNVLSRQNGRLPFEELRITALCAMLVIRCCDMHNEKCDDMLRERLGKITASKRMPDMDALYSGMDAFTGEIKPFDWQDNNVQMCMGILRNNLLKCEFEVGKKPKQ